MHWTTKAFLFIAAAMLMAGPASAAKITVDDDGGADYTTISDAITNANSGDVIVVEPGTYQTSAPLSIQGKNLTLLGPQRGQAASTEWSGRGWDIGTGSLNNPGGEALIEATSNYDMFEVGTSTEVDYFVLDGFALKTGNWNGTANESALRSQAGINHFKNNSIFLPKELSGPGCTDFIKFYDHSVDATDVLYDGNLVTGAMEEAYGQGENILKFQGTSGTAEVKRSYWASNEPNGGNIGVTPGAGMDLTVTDSRFEDNTGDAIWFWGDENYTATIRNNRFENVSTNSGKTALNLAGPPSNPATDWSAQNNNFYDNNGTDMYNGDGAGLDMENNWWGADGSPTLKTGSQTIDSDPALSEPAEVDIMQVSDHVEDFTSDPGTKWQAEKGTAVAGDPSYTTTYDNPVTSPMSWDGSSAIYTDIPAEDGSPESTDPPNVLTNISTNDAMSQYDENFLGDISDARVFIARMKVDTDAVPAGAEITDSDLYTPYGSLYASYPAHFALQMLPNSPAVGSDGNVYNPYADNNYNISTWDPLGNFAGTEDARVDPMYSDYWHQRALFTYASNMLFVGDSTHNNADYQPSSDGEADDGMLNGNYVYWVVDLSNETFRWRSTDGQWPTDNPGGWNDLVNHVGAFRMQLGSRDGTNFWGLLAGDSGTVEIDKMALPRGGDANVDGNVDLEDGSALVSNFGSTSANWLEGDFDIDGDVDLEDAGILVSNFGDTYADTSGTSGEAEWTYDAVVNGLSTQITVDAVQQAFLSTEGLDGATLTLLDPAVGFSTTQPGPGAQVGEFMTSNFITGQELIDISVASAGLYNFEARWNVVGGDENSELFAIEFTEAQVIPEPATLALLGVAAVGLMARRRRKSA